LGDGGTPTVEHVGGADGAAVQRMREATWRHQKREGVWGQRGD